MSKNKVAAAPAAGAQKVVPRLREKYRKEVVPALQKRFSIANVMQVPKLEKIVLNMGVGEAINEPKLIDEAVMVLRNISGQKPVVTKARKAISNFKLRADVPIGCKVTLRGDRMYEFMDRLVAIAIPRIRDFRGLSRKSFDGRGNYTLGLRDQLIFPEIDYSRVSKIKGMNISVVTTAKTDDEARTLLRLFGMPFRN